MTPLLLLVLASSIPSPAPDVPFRQPQLAVGHGIIGMTFGGGGSFYFTSSSDQGRTFAPPVKVAEAGALALGRHRGPRLVILKDALLVSAVVAGAVATGPHAHGLPENGNLTVWRSVDRGQSWKPAGVVNDVPGAAREGLHAMAVGPDGVLTAVWLDLRTPGMKLYGARSTDGGRTWSRNTQLYASPDGTICNCCHPTLAVEPGGRVWVMWRNVVDGHRDLYAAYSDNGAPFHSATKLGTGTWKINACPMDGGGFVLDQGKLTSAWRREGDIYLAEPGQPERRLGPGKDVAIAKSQRGIYTAWTKDGGLVVQGPAQTEPRVLAATGGFATLLALPDGAVLAAWEASGAIETKRLE